MWRLRLRAEAPRYLLGALSAFGLAATARLTIAPPRAAAPAPVRPSAAADLAAQGFAVDFARRLLTWSSAEPEASARALESFGAGALSSGPALVTPSSGEEHVLWAEAVQRREPQPGIEVFTVAAETDSAGLRYVTVTVVRRPGGALALGGYPAFVGAPASSAQPDSPRPAALDDPGLESVVRRAIGNYLAGSGDELSADLGPGASVTLPASPLQMVSAPRDSWAPGGGAVSAVLEAQDTLGARYTLSYELDVERAGARWEITAIQTDPDA